MARPQPPPLPGPCRSNTGPSSMSVHRRLEGMWTEAIPTGTSVSVLVRVHGALKVAPPSAPSRLC
eukprot:9452986-Pyramimonas_sp.AAC.1